jgi:hypothetical protein
MSIAMFAVIVEDLSDDYAFWAALKNPLAANLLVGRDRYQILDGKVLFPSDRHALIRTAGVFGGFQPQPGDVSIAGLNSNTVWAVRILPVQEGRRRLCFFGLGREASNPVVIGPPKLIVRGDKDAVFISDM